MKRLLNSLALAALVIAGVSCNKSNADQMSMIENVNVQCTPEVLEVIADNIPVNLEISYPKGYFHPKATMLVTPILVHEGGELTGTPVIYQGEDIKDNYKVIPANGGTVKESFSFPYVAGCEKSHLELRCVVFYEGKRTEVPAKKVADGCNTTCKLADLDGTLNWKADGYQEIIHQTTEGQILYTINSSDVRGSQLNSESIRDMKEALGEINGNERVTVKGTRIVAYASPEGGEKLNSELSDKRASSAQKAWNKISKGMESGSAEVISIGQDWEGFQEAVAKSNIEDKDLILRVLSMYSDPAVRESEIKNMSRIYTEISDKVFPELRRARFITESEFRNYSAEELEQISRDHLYLLDEPAVLRVAANSDDSARKELLYKICINQFDSDIARFNLAKLYFDKGLTSLADAYLDQMKGKDADVKNAKGLACLHGGNVEKARAYFNESGSDDARCNLGLIDILEGNYSAAAEKYKGAEGNNAALANILVGNLSVAEKALVGDDATADYLHAIICARQGALSKAAEYLKSAEKKNPDLKARAAKDIEFAALAN